MLVWIIQKERKEVKCISRYGEKQRLLPVHFPVECQKSDSWGLAWVQIWAELFDFFFFNQGNAGPHKNVTVWPSLFATHTNRSRIKREKLLCLHLQKWRWMETMSWEASQRFVIPSFLLDEFNFRSSSPWQLILFSNTSYQKLWCLYWEWIISPMTQLPQSHSAQSPSQEIINRVVDYLYQPHSRVVPLWKK